MQIKTMNAWPMQCVLATYAAVLGVYGTPGSLHAAPTHCEPVSRARESLDDRVWTRVATLTKAGSYCLTEDIKSKDMFDFSSGGRVTNKSPMWEVEAGPVQIDLQQHELSSNEPVAPVWVRAPDTSIANGMIRAGGGGGIWLYEAWFTSLRSDHSSDGVLNKVLAYAYQQDVEPFTGQGRTSIQRGGLRLDYMQINAGTSTRQRFGAVGVGGRRSGNSITNSRITVSNGHAAIYFFGAGQRIEGNTIVLKCPDATPSAAPIKLHAADNSVIRNNTIVVDCWSAKPEAAISLVDSRNVVIENNRIIGVKQLYKVWDERPDQYSSVIERDNRFPTLWDRILGR
ncbi:right-handed parallel beta-helix repeat-containing protein [Aquabacterium soli]|uniref:Right-handed parallel beta-helix repeat-containing protein n=1 Tax=Aquabacterium soli TaxID=2493092 RepID=A0A426VAG6_9BURK|nr:right-handed parallel beta-helix repeat-containing protein [Aquabacterium soli]